MKSATHKDIDAFLAALDEADLTVAAWARQHKLPLTLVYQVLHGRLSGRRGHARRIVKTMGLPLPDTHPARASA